MNPRMQMITGKMSYIFKDGSGDLVMWAVSVENILCAKGIPIDKVKMWKFK